MLHSLEAATENNLGPYYGFLPDGATWNNLACERNDLEGLHLRTSAWRYSGSSPCDDLVGNAGEPLAFLHFTMYGNKLNCIADRRSYAVK